MFFYAYDTHFKHFLFVILIHAIMRSAHVNIGHVCTYSTIERRNGCVWNILQEMEHGMVKLLIPTPNSANKIGFNTDRYVFDPTCTTPTDIRHLKFLGLLFGVAMRTKKPLNLHLARPVWKLLAGMTLTPEDLEEVREGVSE